MRRRIVAYIITFTKAARSSFKVITDRVCDAGPHIAWQMFRSLQITNYVHISCIALTARRRNQNDLWWYAFVCPPTQTHTHMLRCYIAVLYRVPTMSTRASKSTHGGTCLEFDHNIYKLHSGQHYIWVGDVPHRLHIINAKCLISYITYLKP